MLLNHCLILLPLVCGGSVFGLCFVMHCFSSFAIILGRKGELVALL